jgi:hypothetical protein
MDNDYIIVLYQLTDIEPSNDSSLASYIETNVQIDIDKCWVEACLLT